MKYLPDWVRPEAVLRNTSRIFVKKALLTKESCGKVGKSVKKSIRRIELDNMLDSQRQEEELAQILIL